MRSYFQIVKEFGDLINLYSNKNNYFLSLFIIQRLLFNKFEAIEQFIPKAGRIIDIGCGYGIFANYLALCAPARHVIGIDKNKRKIKLASRGLPNTEYIYGDVMNVDHVSCSGYTLLDMLHHLNSHEQQENLLTFCYSSLDKGGTILIKEIDKEPKMKYLFTHFADAVAYPFEKIYFREKNEYRKILEGLGCEVEIHSIHQHTPYPAVAIVGKK